MYQIKNTITGDYYIGSSVDLRERLWNHRWRLNRNCHGNEYLQRSWNKYGGDNFTFETILYCDKSMTLYYEQVILDGLKPTFNIAKNAVAFMLGLHHAETTKRKISEANTGNHHTIEARHKMSEAKTGTHPTEEHRLKLSEALIGNKRCLGFHHTEETKQKMSEAHAGERHPLFGKHHTEETKQKISEAAMGNQRCLGKHHTDEAKRKISDSRHQYLASKQSLIASAPQPRLETL